MPAHRFFLDNFSSSQLTGDEFHHLKTVMRARVGDTIELVDGKGTMATATVTSLHSDHATFDISHKHHEPPPSNSIILAQGFTRPALLDWIIEKGTELGATEFWLFPGEQSEKKELTPNQLARLHTLTISALKQSGRLYLPKLKIKPLLSQWKKPTGTLLFGSLAPDAKPLTPTDIAQTIIVIGPEKGFSKNEHTFLEKDLQATGVKLNSNILRAETAALCALSLLCCPKK